MASNLVAIASNLVAMASNLVASITQLRLLPASSEPTNCAVFIVLLMADAWNARPHNNQSTPSQIFAVRYP